MNRFLDWLGYRLFGHLDDVDYDAEWELYDAEQDIGAGCMQLLRDEAAGWTS